MAEDAEDLALARAVAARRWSTNAPFEVQRIDHGSNNTIWRAAGPAEVIVVKLSRSHREAGALAEYRKESWCAARARACGVNTPEVLDFGLLEGRAFAMLAFVDGREPDQERAVWRALGRQARAIHGIAVQGWGGTLTDDGHFGESWQTHLDFNIAALGADDELIARGVFDRSGARRLRREFARLRRGTLCFGLCHGDIAPWNTLIDDAGTTWLLDWGCAAAHVVPHYEINEILRGPRPVTEDLDAFLDGYGLTPQTYAAMAPDLLALAALREVDTLRWALDKKPDMVGELTARARDAVARLA